MRNWLVVLAGLLIIFGALKSISLLFTINIVVHGLLIMGWVVFLVCKGDMDDKLWIDKVSLFGLLMISFGFSVPFFMEIVKNMFVVKDIISGLYLWSGIPFYALGYGLLLTSFRMEKEKLLLYFHIPLMLLWLVIPVLSTGVVDILNNYWFWAEKLTYYPLAFFVLWSLVSGTDWWKKRKYEKIK
jgi:hypothetical protein